jgi:hypothetical protein
MANKKTKYTAEGKDVDSSGKFVDAELTFDLPEPPATRAGMPISKAAFQALKKAYNPAGGTEAVTFDRESLLTILAQYGCTGIRFHFVKKPATTGERLTLAMVGIDASGQELAQSSDSDPRDPLYYEWGQCNPPCP